MRYPNHVILDVQTHQTRPANPSWATSYQKKVHLEVHLLQDLINFYRGSKKSYSFKHPILEKNITTSLKQPTVLINAQSDTTPRQNNILWDIFNINFLRKEKIYTKLKYSRCPQYDIVSGGVAALFSGFIGFLICEKFGLELLDSGDFYTFFMYVVFASFSLRPLLRILSNTETEWHFMSYKYLYTFLRDLTIITVKTFKYYFNKLIKVTYWHLIPWTTVLLNLEFLSAIYHFWRRVIAFLKNWPRVGYKTFKEVK